MSKFFLLFFFTFLVLQSNAQEGKELKPIIYEILDIEKNNQNDNGSITRNLYHAANSKTWYVIDKNKEGETIHTGWYNDSLLLIKTSEHSYSYKKFGIYLQQTYLNGLKLGVWTNFNPDVLPDSVFIYEIAQNKNKIVFSRKITDPADFKYFLDSIKPPVEDKVYTGVEIEATYKGNLKSFVDANLKYSKKMKRKKMKGEVTLNFIIKKDGIIDEVAVDNNSACKEQLLVEEAIRVILLTSGNWNPHIINGKAVKSYQSYTIVFPSK